MRTIAIWVGCSLVCLGCGSAPPRDPQAGSPRSDAPPQTAAALSTPPSPPPPTTAPAVPGPPASTTTAQPAAGPRPRRAALRFELGDHPFPSPIVDVVIGGHPTSMIVDTGATHHVVAEWLARELALPVVTSGDRAVDHTGRAVKVARVEKVGLSIAGWGAVDPPVLLVVAVPDPLRRLGIGGIVAPHLLAAEGRATLLNLRAGTMSDEAEADAERHAGEQGGAQAFSGVRACGGPTEGMVLLAQAAVEGEAAWLKLDSGASSTSLLQSSAAGKRAGTRAGRTGEAYAASGKFASRTIESVKVKVGDFEAAVDLSIEPGAAVAGCPSDGFLGMDVLRSCVLVLHGTKTSGRCAR